MEKHIRDCFNDAILSEAAKLFGTSLEEVKAVGGFENFIYGYQKNEIDYILRIGHSDHRSLEMVEAELDFVNYLAEHQANVSVPIVSINGKLVEVVECADKSYFTVTSYHKSLGTHVRRDSVTDQFFINYGKTIGKLHRLTKDYQEGTYKRYSWDDDLLIKEAREYLPKEELFVVEKLETVVKQIHQIPKNRNNYGLIHTDIHMGNFFVLNDELSVFDFDDSAYQYFISDIAIALFYYVAFIKDEEVRNEKAKQFMTLFMQGYKLENTVDAESFHQIQLFLKLREIILYIVIYRSCDIETDEWAKNYIALYRNRILNNIDFIEPHYIVL
jgi:amicoumacin kinase